MNEIKGIVVLNRIKGMMGWTGYLLESLRADPVHFVLIRIKGSIVLNRIKGIVVLNRIKGMMGWTGYWLESLRADPFYDKRD